MSARRARPLLWMDASLASLLILSFFLPWLSFLGTPVAAHEIRELLSGPHRLVSAFSRDTRISFDYTVSPFLWAVPASAAVVIALRLARRDWAWPSLAAGAAALAAFVFLRMELDAYPFQKLEKGAWLALASGLGLILAGLLRLVPGRAR